MPSIPIFSTLRNYVSVLRGEGPHTNSDATLGTVLSCRVFVINLERSVHRRAYMQRYLSSLGVEPEFLNAVDGSTLELDRLSREGIYDDARAREKFSRSLSLAEIGASLSHVAACRRIVDEHLPMALIVEDDITFIDGVAATLQAALAELPADWELLQLFHWNSDTFPVAPHVVGFNARTALPVGCLGYLVRQSGARKIVEAALPVCYPADSMIGRSPRIGVRLYGVSPPVITLEGNRIFPTEIHRPATWPAAVRFFAKRAVVGLASGLLLRR